MNHESPVRQEFGVMQSMPAIAETASTAAAAQAKAIVESRYIMALRKPRDWDQVRQDIMKECRQPHFALDKSTLYVKPMGGGDEAEGLGIRFAEMALRCMTNVLIEPIMVFEDDDKELHRVSVTDLEGNLTYSTDVKMAKTVERRYPLDDGSFISMRKNSFGKPVYTVPANDDQLLNKRGAYISKAIRTQGLRLLPSNIKFEATELIKKVRLDEVKRDPDAEKKRIADAFLDIGVKVADLTAYLGHALDTCSPPELVKLRGIYGAIRDGEATWKSVVENEDDEPKPGFKTPQPRQDEATLTAQAAASDVSHAQVVSIAGKSTAEPPAKPAPAANNGSEAASANMKQIVRNELATAGLTEQALADEFGFVIDTMPKMKVGAVRTWIDEHNNHG